MNEQRLINLETKLAYQEDTIQQLNDVIFAQQKQIDQLELLCQHLVDRLKELAEQHPADNITYTEIPPHY
jgi:SlyX protein